MTIYKLQLAVRKEAERLGVIEDDEAMRYVTAHHGREPPAQGRAF